MSYYDNNGVEVHYLSGITWYHIDLQRGLWSISPVSQKFNDDWTWTIKLLWNATTPHDGMMGPCGCDSLRLKEGTNLLLYHGDTLLTYGRVVSVKPEDSSSADEITFECRGPWDFLNNDGAISGRRCYNLGDPSDEDYDATRENLTVGDIIKDLFETYYPGSYFTDDPNDLFQNDLPDLDVIPSKVTYTCQMIGGCIIQLLSEYMPHYKTTWVYNEAGWCLVFWNTRELEAIDIYSTDMVPGAMSSLSFSYSLTGVYSAVAIYGAREQAEILDERTGGGGDIDPDWDAAYEVGWTQELADANPDTYGRVWTCYQLSQGGVMEGRLACEEGLKAWVKIGDIWYPSTVSSIERSSGKIVFSVAKVYSNAGVLTERDFKVRYATKGNNVAARYPTVGFEGKAWEEVGIERCRNEYDEDYGYQVIHGKTTKTTTGYITDRFLSATRGKLIGATLVIGEDEYVITDNGWWTIVCAELATVETASGTSYSIVLKHDTSTMATLAEALHGEVSERNYSGSLDVIGIDLSKYALGKKVNLFGFGTGDVGDEVNRDWETIGAVISAVTVDFMSEITSLELSSLTSIGANLEYNELKRRLYESTQIAENEIQIARLNASTGGGDAGGGGGGETSSLPDHKHAASGDGGPLDHELTMWADSHETDYVGELDMEFDEEDEKWHAAGALGDHQHTGTGDGGELNTGLTMWSDGAKHAILQMGYLDHGSGSSFGAAPLDHRHYGSSQSGSGGPLVSATTEVSDGTRTKPTYWKYYEDDEAMYAYAAFWWSD